MIGSLCHALYDTSKYDDDWCWRYSNTLCPLPLDNDLQRFGCTNNSRDQDRSIAQVSPQESQDLECLNDCLDLGGANWTLTSNHHEWATGFGFEPITESRELLGVPSLCQPEFISTLPMPDRDGGTELEFATQSSILINLPATTFNNLSPCMDNEKSNLATSETNPRWMILDFDLQHESTSHGIMGDKTKIQCHECNLSFPNYTSLDLHAKQTFHAPFTYRCSKTFSRQDCLARHFQEFSATALFPCPYCDKYDGTKAFKRRDHLTQHLRGHHRIKRETLTSTPQSGRAGRAKHSQEKTLSYPHGDYFTHRDQERHPTKLEGQRENGGFATQTELTKHLRNAHDESPFPCGEPGCSRKRKHGFFRERDLWRHRKERHSE